ncbi:ROK family protein [Roseibium sp.]|uniref:ROK family protein n=1 Tax=Roseibium sp. TaxID=1936156 RepID=UPI003B52E141
MVTSFDIGGSFIRFAYPKPTGLAIEAGRVPTPLDSWPDFVDALRSCLPDPAGPTVISLAGAFDAETGLADVANIPCLHGRRVASDLNEELGVPVQIINDANAFALAEAVDGAGAGKDTVFAIILGSGVGGGLTHKDALVTGHGGIAGEWGHGPVVDPTAGGTLSGIPHFECGCGQTGCLDVYGSARGLEKLHQALHGTDLSSVQITSAWHVGDLDATKTIEVYTTLLSRALSMVVNLLGPDVIPVSGGLSADEELLAEIDRKTRALTLATYDTPLVLRGAFADNGGLQGASIQARKAFPQEFGMTP